MAVVLFRDEAAPSGSASRVHRQAAMRRLCDGKWWLRPARKGRLLDQDYWGFVGDGKRSGCRPARQRDSRPLEARWPVGDSSVRREPADPVGDLVGADHEPVLEDVVVW